MIYLTITCHAKASVVNLPLFSVHYVVGWEYRLSAHFGLGEIDGLLAPPGKASNLLTDHMITG